MLTRSLAIGTAVILGGFVGFAWVEGRPLAQYAVAGLMLAAVWTLVQVMRARRSR